MSSLARLAFALSLLGLLLAGAAGALGHTLPAGEQLLYTALSQGKGDLFLMDVSRGIAHNLTRSPVADTAPTWSPDGRRIAFLAARDSGEGYRLMVMDVGKNGQTRSLAEDYWAEGQPAWSPDGRQIAFLAVVNRSRRIAVVDLDRRSTRLVSTNGTVDSSVVWSPDGSHLLFLSFRDGSPRTYIASLDCDHLLRGCAYNDHLLLGSISAGWPPAASPDGQYMAFTVLFRRDSELYTIDLDCMAAPAECMHTRLRRTDNDWVDQSPAWSPDSRRIAFVAAPGGQPDIYVLELATGESLRLTWLNVRRRAPAWSPDGHQLAFVREQGKQADIYLVDIETGLVRRLTSQGVLDSPLAWRP